MNKELAPLKAILISIKPKYVAKILNGEKTIEIRKRFPKDYRGWVYIYCTKEKPRAILTDKGCVVANTLAVGGNSQYKSGYSLSGEVVARFWCDKVEHFEYDTCSRDICGYWLDNGQIFKNKGTCLSADELWNYIKGKDGYTIQISKLEIFDEPKELSEFWTISHKVKGKKGHYTSHKISKAPQSFQYIIESEE